jgi:uncharacterized membrane protein YqjE
MADGNGSPSILETARRLGSTVLDIAETRLALFSIDLQEAAHRYAKLAVWSVVGVFCFVLGILLVTLAVITMFWETHRLAALTFGACLFLGASAMIAALIMRSLRQHRNLFAATMGELAKDREHLGATP